MTLKDMDYILELAQTQNFSTQYTEDIALGLSYRTAIYDLPQIMKEFSRLHPSVSISTVEGSSKKGLGHTHSQYALSLFIQVSESSLFSTSL